MLVDLLLVGLGVGLVQLTELVELGRRGQRLSCVVWEDIRLLCHKIVHILAGNGLVAARLRCFRGFGYFLEQARQAGLHHERLGLGAIHFGGSAVPFEMGADKLRWAVGIYISLGPTCGSRTNQNPESVCGLSALAQRAAAAADTGAI